MSSKNGTNPIDIDMTVQMQNDRLTFQYQSIVHKNTGVDLLQNVLDSNSTVSDSQVEIAIDTNDIYTENGTNANISNLLAESYSLILPKKNTLISNTSGVIVFAHDSAYNTTKKSLDSDDMFQQNSRSRYPAKSMVGRFVPLSEIAMDSNVTTELNAIKANVSILQSNITTIETNITNLESNVSIIQGNITTIESNITNINTNITNLESNVSIIQGNITSLDSRVTVLEAGSGGVGGGIIKAPSDENATTTITNETGSAPVNGDLYYNTQNNLYNTYYTDITNVDQWFPIAMTKLAGQPPPLTNVTTSNTTAYIDVSWELPYQVATPLTSNIAYNTLNSPASAINGYSQNVMFFPIVNRLVMKLTEVNATTDVDIAVKSYPLYYFSSSNFTSLIDTDGYVIYPKGSKLTTHDTTDATRTSYTSNTTVINQHLLENVPTSIRLYKTIPTRVQRQSIISSVDSQKIIPFSSDAVGSALDLSGQRYKIELWLENNSNDTAVKISQVYESFKIADPPLAPTSTTLDLTQSSSTSVTSALSQARMVIQDPPYVAGSDNSEDAVLSFTEIKFEWSDDGFNSNTYNFAKVRHNTGAPTTETHSGTYDITLSSGVYSINRTVDSTGRYYTFDFSTTYLGADYSSLDFTLPITISVRISYKNGSNPSYGPTSTYKYLHIGYPQNPSITGIQLIDGNTFRISVGGYSVVNSTLSGGISNVSNVSANEDYAVFLRTVEVQGEYELDNGAVISYDNLTYDYSGTTTPTGTTTYDFDIPAGLPSGTFATDSYKWRFTSRVKNNIIDFWSGYSAITGNSGTDNATLIDPTATQSVEFVETTGTNTFTEAAYITNRYIRLDWSNPSDGERGIDPAKAATNYHKMYKNILDINVDGQSVSTTLTTSNYDSDVYTPGTKESLLVFDLINDVGATYTDIANDTNIQGTGSYNDVNITLSQQHHYIDTLQNISIARYYSLRFPDTPSGITFSPTVRTGSGYNEIDLSWSKPAFQGFRYGNTAALTASHNTSLNINRYIVQITTNVSNTGSPYYNSLYSGNNSVQNTIDASQYYNEAGTSMLNLVYNSVLTNSTGSSDTSNDVFVYPDMGYNVQIYDRNTYGLQSPTPLIVDTSRTGLPGSYRSILGSAPVPTQANLANRSAYTNYGFILDTTDYDNAGAHTDLGAGYQITPNSTIDYTSSYSTHLMNQAHMMNYQTNYITDATNQKFRQLRVINEADSNGIVKTLGVGNATTYDQFSDGATDSYWSDSITLQSASNRDVYNTSGFDVKNTGYWWEEQVRSSVNTDTTLSNASIFSYPHKLSLQVRYNKSVSLSSSVNYGASNLSVDGDVDIVSSLMLYNSLNTNQYAYIDNLTTNPSLAQRGSTNLITEVSQTNYINGIPNLYPVSNSTSYEYRLNYVADGYSQHFGLNTGDNILTHYARKKNSPFTTIKSAIQDRDWNTKTNITRTSTNWQVENITITNTTIGYPSETSTHSDIGFYTTMQNTRGSTSSLLTGYGDLDTFIYDKRSADLVNGTTKILTVEDGFNPNSTTYSNSTVNSTVFNWYGASSSGNPTSGMDQLFIYDAKFMTEAGTYSNFSSLFSSKASYGIPASIPLTPTNPVRWTIHKYETSAFGSTTTSKMFYFSFGSTTDLEITDVTTSNASASDDMSEDCKIYAQIELYNPGTATATPLTYISGSVQKKWIRYSGPYYATSTLSAANLETLAATVENYNHSLQFKNPSNNSDWLSTSYSPESGTPTSGEQRTCWGIFNKLTIPQNYTVRIYLAIGLTQSATNYFEKPSTVQFIQSGTETSTQVEFTAS